MKRRANIATLLSMFLLLVTASAASAQAEDVYSERTLELARKLACPVCEGQSVAASQARLATEMKQTIESQVQAGMSDQEILDFFVARFGEEVLLEPPQSGATLPLWWIPVIALLLGGLVVVLYLRDNLRPSSRRTETGTSAGTEADIDPELEALADDVLGSTRQDRDRQVEQGAG